MWQNHRMNIKKVQRETVLAEPAGSRQSRRWSFSGQRRDASATFRPSEQIRPKPSKTEQNRVMRKILHQTQWAMNHLLSPRLSAGGVLLQSNFSRFQSDLDPALIKPDSNLNPALIRPNPT
jgi:hypothetical protein